MTPKVGIFWFYKEKILAHASPVLAGDRSCSGLIDSSKNHADVWDEDRILLADFPELRGMEYFSIPRGRVLWNHVEKHAVVYMDSTLFNDRCKDLIVDFFDLGGCEVKWKRDVHYRTSPEDLAAIFDDESAER